MANLIISGRNAERLQEIAEREHRPVEQVLTDIIDSYIHRNSQRASQSSSDPEGMVNQGEANISTNSLGEVG